MVRRSRKINNKYLYRACDETHRMIRVIGFLSARSKAEFGLCARSEPGIDQIERLAAAVPVSCGDVAGDRLAP